MAIAFRDDSTRIEWPFILVSRDGRGLGRIVHTAGMYRFFLGDYEMVGNPELVDADLGRLKAVIRYRYDQNKWA